MGVSRYRKLVTALVGVVAFAGNQLWGWSTDEAMIEQTINGIIAILTLVGIERLPNDRPFDESDGESQDHPDIYRHTGRGK